MQRIVFMLLWILHISGPVAAQQEKVQRALPPWLTGIIAVVVFLSLVFISFIVNKVWCQDSGQEGALEQTKVNEYTMTNGTNHDLRLVSVRSIEHENAYENVTMQTGEVTVTAM
ncbi:PDZK1-interacting protein 1 [Lepisosteus oculatus]|uniref:PDZK1-interacting protein 1 n=1 Tax=Lepisosteus oculatus TaxID=7918 RepID=UPI0007403B0C|nr:PREDICTED: PDZK1-interacting protein 1 [Lepisosteus oculatus]